MGAIYFAVTTGPESYLNLQNYFQLEGLAYRLVPIKSTKDEMIHQTRVYSDKMYENIMSEDRNKWGWGGMDNVSGDGANMDENCMRMAMNMRIQMTTLASVLIQENKTEKAKKVLDKMMKVMPEKNVPYDGTLYTAVVLYYRLGMAKEATDLAKKLFGIFEHDANFYYSIDDEEQDAYGREIRSCQEILQGLRDMVTNQSMIETNEKMKNELKATASNFQMRVANLYGK